MASRRRKSSGWVAVLLIIAAIVLWFFEAIPPGPTPIPPDGPPSSANPDRYETHENCALVEDRSNDGDSFRVILPGGRSEIFRLYFVDSPESAFKTYAGGRDNHGRIADQARDLGAINSRQAVSLGREAKNFSLATLSASPFTLFTEWDSPFKDGRYHAFILLNQNPQPRFLHELLVEKGLARIHTKGAPLPGGTSISAQKARLLELERSAKAARLGAWAF